MTGQSSGSVKQSPIAIIGGGVSGMAAAYYLSKAGCSVDLYEQESALGGRVGLDDFKGETVCFGGKNIGYDYKEFRGFLSHYGDPNYEYFGINSARLENGKIRVFNSHNKIKTLLTLLSAAKFSDLWRLRKLMHYVQRNRVNGDINAPDFRDLRKRNKYRLNHHFSPSFLNKIIRPLTVRMNGAEPEKISIENFGSHLQMLQDEYEQLNTSFADIFASVGRDNNIHVFLNTSVTEIIQNGVGYSVKTRESESKYNAIILAVPAPIAGQLLKVVKPSISRALETVQYFPVGVIIADYQQDVFTKKIRALVLGQDSPISNIGAYSAEQLSRVRYTLSGALAEEHLHETLDEDHLLKLSERLAKPYFNIENNNCQFAKLKYWQTGLCAYTQDENNFQNTLETELQSLKGLYLTGDYRKGASIENCFRASKAAVEQYLSEHKSVPDSRD